MNPENTRLLSQLLPQAVIEQEFLKGGKKIRNEVKPAKGGKVRKYVLVVAVFLGLVFVTNSGFAFRLCPASVKTEIRRGGRETLTLNVGSRAEKSVSCRVYTTGFEVKRNGKQLFEKATEKYSAANWIKVKPSEFEISPNGTEKIKVEISVPRSAKSGEYFAVIMAESRAPARAKTPKGTTISFAVVYRLGCITRITIPGRTIIRKKAKISEVRVEIDRDVKVIATLENKCPVHLDAEGSVKIKNLEGRIFDKFLLQGAGKNVRGEAFVYPEGMRDFWGTITRPLPPGEYVAEVSFTYGYRFRKIRAKTTFTLTETVAAKQKELLILAAKPELLEYSLVPGGYHVEAVEVENMDIVENLEIVAQSNAEWLKVSPGRLKLAPERRRKIKVIVRIPRDTEIVKRDGKIMFKAERGKPVFVDVVVHDAREKESVE